MPLAWSAIENVLHAWFSKAINGTVIWSNQSGTQPATPYGMLKLTGPRQSSPLPEIASIPTDDDVSIDETVIIHGEITVSCQVFAAPTTGPGTARELLENARLALHLPSQRATFSRVGLALVAAGDTRDLTALIETDWQSRAAMDVRFNVVDVASERIETIAEVNITGSAS